MVFEPDRRSLLSVHQIGLCSTEYPTRPACGGILCYFPRNGDRGARGMSGEKRMTVNQ